MRQGLAPDGILAPPHPRRLPPRDSLKLFLTALLALEEEGARTPERQVALLRSWDVTLLLVRNGPLTEADLGRIREFAAARSFDLAYLPGLRADEANRFNVLDQPYFFEGAQALIGPQRQEFLDRYKFSLAPATDERPYFFDFFRWQALPELWTVALTSGAGLLDWGFSLNMGRTSRARTTCAGDTALDPRARVLRYGSTWRQGPFSCTSRTAGLTCRNAAGHGWFMSRQRWRRF